MDRNKAAILDTDAILRAAKTVFQITVLLRLQQQQFHDMFEVDVTGQIAQQDSTRGELFAFARGVEQAYLQAILLDHCDFIYVLRDGTEVSCKGAAAIDPVSLAEATCGYSWRDSDFAFGEFEATVPL